MQRLCFIIFLLVMIILPMQADDTRLVSPHFGLYGSIPVNTDNDFSFGFTGEARFNQQWGLMLDLNFMKGYYSYENGSWLGPMSWKQVNSGTSKREDWIFWQQDCVSTLFLNYYLPINSSDFNLGFGLGPSINWIISAPSVDNYPEFESVYKTRRDEVFSTMGLQFRMVAEVKLYSYFYIGTTLKTKIRQLNSFEDELADVGWQDYMRNNSDVSLYLTVGF